jgi:hypothetical protein
MLQQNVLLVQLFHYFKAHVPYLEIFLNVVLDKDGKDHVARSCEK